MDETTDNTTEWVSNRMNEAKVYFSMGLYDEAREVYRRILTEHPELPSHMTDLIQEKLDAIEAEIAERNDSDSQGLSPEEISFVGKQLPGAKEDNTSSSRAKAFMETGKYQDALDEFRKLFGTPVPLDKFLGDIVECIIQLYGSSEAPAQIEALGSDASLGKQERARLTFKLGTKLEEHGQPGAALELYRAAHKIVPEDLEMSSALDEKIAALSKDSRYAYILNQGWISEEDLEKAVEESKTANKSVESILLSEHNITKEDLGKSLSIFYGFPFKSYDRNIQIPAEVFSRLDMPTLSQEGWVPLASYNDGVDVLMVDPGDEDRLHRIRSLLGMDTIHPFVGIQEEIEAFIERFFRELGTIEKTTPPHAKRATRREKRFVPAIPDFAYAEFRIKDSKGKEKEYRLPVLNSSESGIGLLVEKPNSDLLPQVRSGSVLSNVTFYAEWTLIRVDVIVRHVTPIQQGKHKGAQLLGVESQEIVESSKVPS
ncbi:MAG: hypothetical protein PVG49_05975 [Desulfobacteraceae bacterium]